MKKMIARGVAGLNMIAMGCPRSRRGVRLIYRSECAQYQAWRRDQRLYSASARLAGERGRQQGSAWSRNDHTMTGI